MGRNQHDVSRSRETSTRFNDFCTGLARASPPFFLYFSLRRPRRDGRTKTAESARTVRLPCRVSPSTALSELVNVVGREQQREFLSPSLANGRCHRRSCRCYRCRRRALFSFPLLDPSRSVVKSQARTWRRAKSHVKIKSSTGCV